MKKDSNRAAFTLRYTLLLMAGILLILAWPVTAAPTVGGTSLDTGDLGGGDDGGGVIVRNVGSATLEQIDRNFEVGGVDDGSGGDDDGGSELEDRVNPLSTGFSTTLSDLNNGGPFNYNYDPNSPNNNNGTTNSNSSDPVVYFGLVERRPDFEYNDGHREFAPTETYTTGQKGLGVGPGLRSKRTQYSPLGEF